MRLSWLLYIVCNVLIFSCKSTTIPTSDKRSKEIPAYNTINFEQTPYGLIFTDLTLQERKVKTMIDFGDPNLLQLSSLLVANFEIPVKETGKKARFITGEEFDINAGKVEAITIGNIVERDVEFFSSPGEMESVSQQIGTMFNASLGWGYFKNYFTILDYSAKKFMLFNEKQTPSKSIVSTSFAKNSSYLEVEVSVGQHDVKAIIDTGSSVSIIHNGLAEKLDNTPLQLSIDGVLLNHKLMVEDLSMLADLEVSIIIGSDLLSKYKVYIDPVANKIVFGEK